MAGNTNARNNLLIDLFPMFLMITSFTQRFSQRIKHAISKTVVRQQIMAFGPLVETGNSENTGNFRMFIQIYKRRLDKNEAGFSFLKIVHAGHWLRFGFSGRLCGAM